MKFFILSFTVLIGAAHAEARPSTFKMTCLQTQELVEAHGSIALNYAYSKKAGPLYNRYVSSTRYCTPGEKISGGNVPTLDNENCSIGYICSPPVPNN